MLNKKTRAGAALALAFFVSASRETAQATEIKLLEGPHIQKALSNKTAFESGKTYRPWRQYFAADGTTVYFGDGPSSFGNWEIRGNLYCSLWPPVKEWECYRVELAGDAAGNLTIVWIAKNGWRTRADLFDGDLTALRAPPKN